MADDRLDDAIDAVVRAVDRIERATRGVFEAPPAPERTRPAVPAEPTPPPNDLGRAPHLAGFAEAPTTSAAEPAVPAPGAPAPEGSAASVHELVGRIVGATQQLEDHLEAARGLRAELSELVSRLAAQSDR